MRLDRIIPKERHPRSAGMQPRASREQCVAAPWGDARPLASFGPGQGSIGRVRFAEKDQRGRTGMDGAVV